MEIFVCAYLVKNCYRITVAAEEPFICSLLAGGRTDDQKGGIMKVSEIHSFTVPQRRLDAAGAYTVVFRKFIRKQAYDTLFGDEESKRFVLRAAEKPANICYIADIHGDFSQAASIVKEVERTAGISALAFGGDMGEIENKGDALAFCRFISEITKGEIPVIFCRGNHDTRGGYAQEFMRYVGADGDKGYFVFSYRGLEGLVLDCGEDKIDDFYIYGGGNVFHKYRLKETGFIRKVGRSGKKFDIAFCHISFMLSRSMHDIFDIEADLYDVWARELNIINPRLMVCGHIHYTAFDPPSDRDLRKHNYPVLSGAGVAADGGLTCSLISFSADGAITIMSADKDGVKREAINV